jgi:hypothetical protein
MLLPFFTLAHHTFTFLHLASTLLPFELLPRDWQTFLPPSFYLASNWPPTLINIPFLLTSVANPDPDDPYVLEHAGSGADPLVRVTNPDPSVIKQK